MPYKLRGRQEFRFNDRASAICHNQDTRYGFRHIADLVVDGREVDRASAPYYNRTWEAYRYQSVLRSLVEKTRYLSAEEKEQARRLIDCQFAEEEVRKVDREFGMVAMVASLGNIFATDLVEQNAWKLRMIRAGLGEGFFIPDDWHTLSEEEKGERLDKIVEMLKQPTPR